MLLKFKRNKKTAPEGYLTVLSPVELLEREKVVKLIQKCRKLVSLSKDNFDQYYLMAIENYAAFVQLTPASEFNHHSYPGGLLEHTLESVIYALKARKGLLLPPGVTAEIEPDIRDIYTYGIFCSILCHDLAKPAVDQIISYVDKKTDETHIWNPFEGTLLDVGAVAYQVQFNQDRQYKAHEKSALLFVSKVIPTDGLGWLKSNSDVFNQFVGVLTGSHDATPLFNIVKQADQYSTSKALGAEQAPTYSSQKPLPLKIKTALRLLIKDGHLSINRKGANGWVSNEALWLLAKTAVDEIRDHLEAQGHTGVPTDNSRMFDIMMDHRLIEKNPHEGKAIWKIKVETLDWQPTNVFNVIRVPIEHLSNLSLTDFHGIVSVVGGEDISQERPVSKEDENTTIEEKTGAKAAVKNSITETAYDASIDDIDPYLTEYEPTTDTKTNAPISQAPCTNENMASIRAENTGTNFIFWLKESIASKTLTLNTSESLIHIVNKGVLLVSPAIFKLYGEQHNEDWSSVQKSFQALRLNIKTRKKGENTFKVRVTGKRKITTLNGWILPLDEFQGSNLPGSNSHLEVLEDG